MYILNILKQILSRLIKVEILKYKNEESKMTELASNENIFPLGHKALDYFIGDAYVEMLMTNPDYDCLIYNVTFEPKARNYWHKHSSGQILLVTHGEGFYQERGKEAQYLNVGDIVEIPANVEHWHGASANSKFIHVGITPKSSQNKVEWLEPVTDEEYNSL